MKTILLVGSSILSISIFAFFLRPNVNHALSIVVMFICLVLLSAMHTVDERKKLVATSRNIQLFEVSPIAKQYHALPKGAYVYIIQDIDITGYCKIGKTNTVYQRVHNFGVKLPFRVQVVHVIQCQNMSQVESGLHRLFASKRIDGEWFNLDSTDIEFLKTVAVEQ